MAAERPDPVQHFDTLAARREGWTVLNCGPREDGSVCIQLKRLDDLPDVSGPVFESDGDAWQHVVAHAREGSLLHLGALALVDRQERCIIELACGPW